MFKPSDLHTLLLYYKIYIFYLFITQHLLPPPQGRHASCHEMSLSKRVTKLKKEKKIKKFSPFPMHSPSQTPAIYSYSASFSLPAWHLNLFLLNNPWGYQSLSSWPTHWMTTNTLSYIDSLSNPFILHPLHIVKSPENTLINTFIYSLHPFAQLPYLCIWDYIHPPNTEQASEVVHLYRPNPRSLLLP